MKNIAAHRKQMLELQMAKISADPSLQEACTESTKSLQESIVEMEVEKSALKKKLGH